MSGRFVWKRGGGFKGGMKRRNVDLTLGREDGVKGDAGGGGGGAGR